MIKYLLDVFFITFWFYRYPRAFRRLSMSLDSRSGSTFLIRKIMYSVALRYPEPSRDFTSLSYRGFGIGILTYSTMTFPFL